ncbi:eukaryotic translation initiation factor 5B [Trifolium repens]|nr:eukaryotic translation initiation factor 5B [Trifolium repens]
MLTEEKPEEFASPEQNHENGSKKKKKKKKNNETLPQSNEHSQPQVSSEPLVVTPISEFKSNQEESNEPKPSLDATVSAELENKKEVEKIEVCAEFGETGSGKIKKRKRKSKSEKGKIGDVVVVENALNHDKEQVNSIIDRSKRQKCVQDGAQSNEHNVESAETAVQISVVDREVSPVDSITGLNNQFNSENEHNVGPAETVVQMSVIDSEVSRVNSEPSVVTPISEFKSNEEAYAEFAKNQTGEIKKKKRKKKKSLINGEESNEPKPSLDAAVSTEFENKKEVEKSEVYAEFAKTQTGEKRKRKSKSETGKMGEVVVAENVLNHDSEQVNEIDRRKRQKSVQDGAQSNEHNVEPAETTVQISMVDREVSPVDPTIRLNNQPANLVEQKDERRISKEKYLELLKMRKIAKEEERKMRQEKHLELMKMHKIAKEERKIAKEEEKKIRQEKHLELMKMHKIAKEERKIAKEEEKKIRQEKQLELIEMQKKANEERNDGNKNKTQVESKDELKSTGEEKTNSGICLACREPNHSIKQCQKLKSLSKDEEICFFCGEIGHSLGKCSVYIAGEIKKKKRKKKSVINGEESNESKPSLDATVSTEFENKKEVEKSEVYAEFPKTQTGEKRKRKSESETGKMGEVVLVENVLNHDSEQVNEIDSRKRQKSVHDGAQSNEHNVEPAETVVQISVVDREVSPVDPTIRLNNQPANLVEQKDERKISQEKELLKMHRKELRKIRQEKHLELRKMSKIAREKRKIRHEKQLELVKMQMKAKEELKSTGEKKTNSGICWACREPNHSIKQCRKLKSLSKDEEICFFCGEIGHSLGKCSVYIAGGGRLARCLFCNLHGHFSYNCPGHGYFQGAVAGGS